MSTGYLVNGSCYSSLSDATDIYFSAIPATVAFNATAGTTLVDYFVYNSGWKIRSYSISAAGVWSSRSADTSVGMPSFASCVVEQDFLDGMTVGWAVALVLVIAWGARLVRRKSS